MNIYIDCDKFLNCRIYDINTTLTNSFINNIHNPYDGFLYIDGIDFYLDDTNKILHNVKTQLNTEYLQIKNKLPQICEYIKLKYNQEINIDDIYVYNIFETKQNNSYIYIDYDMDYTPVLYNPTQAEQDYFLNTDISKLNDQEKMDYSNLLYTHKVDIEKLMNTLDINTNIHIKFKASKLLFRYNDSNEIENINSDDDSDEEDYSLYYNLNYENNLEDEQAYSKKYNIRIFFDAEFIVFSKD